MENDRSLNARDCAYKALGMLLGVDIITVKICR